MIEDVEDVEMPVPVPAPTTSLFYGLAPVSNTSDSLSRTLSKEQNAIRLESKMTKKNQEPT